MRQGILFILVTGLAAANLGGCAAPAPRDGAPPVPDAAPRPRPESAGIRPGPWLGFDRSGDGAGPWRDCPMVADAAADTARSWLWARLDLAEGSVRVAGVGALSLRIRTHDGERWVRDRGIRVPLEAAAKAYLNSEGGPFTIRPRHVAAAAEAPGCLLIGLPRLDAAAEVVGVMPVPGRWSVLP